MSRTYKDKPTKLRKDSWDKDREYVPCIRVYTDWYTKEPKECNSGYFIDLPTTKTKKRKEVDSEDHWLNYVPSWWNNLFHTRPIRGSFRSFCKGAQKASILDMDELLEPSDSNKPHKYYY